MYLQYRFPYWTYEEPEGYAPVSGDERELLGLTDQVLEKLDIMTDTEFEQLELYPEFEE